MYKTLIEAIEDSQSIAISGHIRPDGDCVGSTTALYNYIKKNYPDKTVRLFLERIPPEMAAVITAPEPLNGEEWDEKFDLFVSLDASTPDRLGPNLRLFQEAGYRFVVDHHVTNRGFGDTNHIVGEAASCCEVLFDLLEEDKIDVEVGKCIYLGIVHDTGVFKFPSTSRHTMEVAGILVEKGVRGDKIIDGSFYEKTWSQNKLLGIALDKAKLYFDGYVAATVITREDLKSVGCTLYDTDGIVDQLRLTQGVEIAMFIREDGDDFYKFSLRAKNGEIDVSEISVAYKGGGHEMAAGFSAHGKIEDLIKELLENIEKMRPKK